ncbi:hypothetical protein E2C01_066356 [Portunus trituberculatus]|uniref:Uncharacterized protein n=1 Tax=Portunus trituberculatus TaxID=210409 RepID=A0A5B7HPJ3_PORTR|nr:hypothetical protein [Portunus trituberculatus]
MCGVCNIKEKIREVRLRYFAHVKRRDEGEPVKEAGNANTSYVENEKRYEDDEPVKKAMLIPVRKRRSVGRQRIRWFDVLKRGMNNLRIQEEAAMSRNRWKKHHKCLGSEGRVESKRTLRVTSEERERDLINSSA